MKKQIFTRLTIGLFGLFLAAMLAGTLVPKADFSENEKRYLAEFPAADWSSVTSGSWGAKLETWLADHIPGRNFFVGLDAYKERALGQPGEIRVYDGRLTEAPVQPEDARIAKNLAAIRRLADTAEVTLALVPSAGWAAGVEDYRDEDIIASIYAQSGLDTIDLTAVFAGKPELFYRTDHHWTSAGANAAYQAIAAHFGREARQDFEVEVLADCFRGSTYSRSALWLTEPESLELWHGSDAVTVTIGEQEPHSVFYRDRLNEADKYTVFLDGNHPLVRLHNPEGTGRLLVIRDSYSNCLGPFLAETWAEVTLADLRYYRLPLTQLAQEGFDEILILYSIGNFCTDPNLVLIR